MYDIWTTQNSTQICHRFHLALTFTLFIRKYYCNIYSFLNVVRINQLVKYQSWNADLSLPHSEPSKYWIHFVFWCWWKFYLVKEGMLCLQPLCLKYRLYFRIKSVNINAKRGRRHICVEFCVTRNIYQSHVILPYCTLRNEGMTLESM